jgi:hypothetical protein
MGGFVVLVEGVGAPEALVTAIARIFARTVVKLLLVSLPVKLALKRLVAGRAPKLGLVRGGARRRDGTAYRGRREVAVAARTT